MLYSKNSSNLSSKAELTTGHGAFRPPKFYGVKLWRARIPPAKTERAEPAIFDNLKFFFGGKFLINQMLIPKDFNLFSKS